MQEQQKQKEGRKGYHAYRFFVWQCLALSDQEADDRTSFAKVTWNLFFFFFWCPAGRPFVVVSCLRPRPAYLHMYMHMYVPCIRQWSHGQWPNL